MRKFDKHVCSKYDTKDLPSELAARTRRQQRKAINITTTTPGSTQKGPTGPRRRKFNMETYKYHALGDYATSIRLHGPLDGYSSQLVCFLILFCGCTLISNKGELEHRRSKRFYPIVQKGNHAIGIGKAVSRERLIQLIAQKGVGATHSKVQPNLKGRKPVKEPLPHTLPTTHHHISAETRNKVDIADLLDENEGDPALEVYSSQYFLLPFSNLCFAGLCSSIT
jgi:hypothetical protein